MRALSARTESPTRRIDTGRRCNDFERRLTLARPRLPELWASACPMPLMCQRLKIGRADVLRLAAEMSLNLDLKVPAKPALTVWTAPDPGDTAEDVSEPAPAPDLAMPVEREPRPVLTCQWPTGHPHQPGFHLCGATRHRGSYCASHYDVAYTRVRRAD